MTPAAAAETVTVTVNDEPLTVAAGRTVASALILARQQHAWRSTRFLGQPRGLFCGIGVCFDCLVRVDGRASMRACLVQVTDGMVIETEDAVG